MTNIIDILQYTQELYALYVEDDKNVRESTTDLLENYFQYLDTAEDGEDALRKYEEYYKKNSKYYDLIITDINMPRMNGIAMSKAILQSNPQQNIIVLSAHNDSDRLQELINIGISNYIYKPIQSDTLTSALQKTLLMLEVKNSKEREFDKIQTLNHELDALVDSFDTYVIASRTDLKGKITYASRAYETISGYTEEELLGKPHNIVRHPDMPSAAFKEMWETIQDERLWVGEVKNLRKDSSYYWVHASVAPYYDSDKNHIGYSAIRIDITVQKEVEALHAQVNNLLNNVGQGFLSFNSEMRISKSFSKECLHIFNTDDIAMKNISDLLFDNDSVKKELFIDGINRALESDEMMLKEMFLSLLPQEHTLHDKVISIKYKALEDDTFILVLSDITKTKALEQKIKKQRQVQKMIVAIASDKNDFIELKYDFESFIQHPSRDLQTLLRDLHTFKGIFAQKEMLHIVDGIHTLETKINEISKENGIEAVLDVFTAHQLQEIFDRDLEIITKSLGDAFLEETPSLNVSLEALENLESKMKNLTPSPILDEIRDDFEKIRYESLYSMLSSYSTIVKKIAQNLEKEIYPLEIIGDRSLHVSPSYKPLIKSFIHLFNNCIDHGIEDMETRIENEKDEMGTIRCEFTQIDETLKIMISDDGAGIDIEKLSLNAQNKKIKTQDELDRMSEEEKLFLIFADNLSTKENLSQTSGRGVGMSALKSEIERLSGTIEIQNTPAKGVNFIFSITLK
ncbi:MAG: response regulator [Campylobacterota bacterium]|nr:response regulator [Campylobacterota bacterium]